MPIITTIHPDVGLVTHCITGSLSLADIARAIDQLFNDPAFHSDMHMFVQLSPGATSSLSSVDVSRVVAMLQSASPKRGTGRSAVVAPSDADYGLVQVVSQLLQGGPRDLAVFHDQASAMEWLGLSALPDCAL